MTFVVALPKHAVIFQRLHQAIRQGSLAPGARLPSENALARRYGVSRPTVAQALRELQRLDLVERHRGAGSFVRVPPASQGSLGLLADGLGATEILEPLSVELARSARAAGWAVISGSAVSDRSPEAVALEWSGRGVRGLFFAPVEHHPVRAAVNAGLAGALQRRGIAVVLLDRDMAEFPGRSGLDLVAIDDYFAGFELAAHLLGRGSRRIAFVARPGFPSTTDLRADGARAAAARTAGASFSFAAGDPQDLAWLSGVTHGADAIIAANDATAALVLQGLGSLGHPVPGAIRVAGFDDVRYARLLSPTLTTMRQPCAALGLAAVEVLLGRLRQPQMPARRVLLRAELVVRQSTA